MNTSLVALVTVAVLAAPAAAESYDATEPPAPSRGYLAVGSMGGVDEVIRLGMLVEGGYRLAPASRVFVRGQVSTGVGGGWLERGSYQQLRLGLEAKQCAGQPESLCAFAGADLAASRDILTATDQLDAMSTTTYGGSVIPRAGGEIGERLRLRGAVELPMYKQLDAGRPITVGVAITVGVGYTF